MTEKQKTTLDPDALAARYGISDRSISGIGEPMGSRLPTRQPSSRSKNRQTVRPESTSSFLSEARVALGTLAVGSLLIYSGVRFMEGHGFKEHNPWSKAKPAHIKK